jgi:hypothetical protein
VVLMELSSKIEGLSRFFFERKIMGESGRMTDVKIGLVCRISLKGVLNLFLAILSLRHRW